MTADDNDSAPAFIEETYNHLVRSGSIRVSVDKIPYTEDFERLFLRVSRRYPLTRNEVFVTLMNRRKDGRCPAPPK